MYAYNIFLRLVLVDLDDIVLSMFKNIQTNLQVCDKENICDKHLTTTSSTSNDDIPKW